MQGVERYKVALSPHKKEWAEEFLAVKSQLKSLLGDALVDVQHVGSTAIAGISAKPILDVAAVFSSFEEMDVEKMEGAGYQYCDAQNEGKTRYLFVMRGEGQISLRHIHCFTPGDAELAHMTGFRDYLNAHTEKAQEYESLKKSLALRYPDDRIAYTDGKEEFILNIYRLLDAGEE